MVNYYKIICTIVMLGCVCACDIAGVVFRDTGAADTSTATFALAPGSYVVEYDLADRDPLLGCPFSVALVRQPAGDPLAPGVVVGQSPEVAVKPRGTASGSVPFVGVNEGSYYLRIGGSCDWEVVVVRGGSR